MKTWYTTADNYVVHIHRDLEEPLRSLVVASALGIDTALNQDSAPGFGSRSIEPSATDGRSSSTASMTRRRSTSLCGRKEGRAEQQPTTPPPCSSARSGNSGTLSDGINALAGPSSRGIGPASCRYVAGRQLRAVPGAVRMRVPFADPLPERWWR